MPRNVPLTTARVRFDLRSMTASLITGAPDGNGDWKERSSAALDIFEAFNIAARDLPEDDKIFFVKDLLVCEMPHMRDWVYREDLPIFEYKGTRYKTVRTREEAKTILREMLQDMLASVDAPTGYSQKTWHGDRVARGL